MILKNIATLDVNYRYSLRAATKLQKNIYSYYNRKKIKLRNIINAIKACLPLPFECYNPMDFNSNIFMAGNILYLYHLYLENLTKVSKNVSDDSISRKKCICICCGIDLNRYFGEKGCEPLEQHYTEDLSSYHNGMTVLPGKFVPLCPTCHKFAHSDPDLFKLSSLQKVVMEESTKNV